MLTAKKIREAEELDLKIKAVKIAMAKLESELMLQLPTESTDDGDSEDFEQLRIAFLYFKILLSTKEYEEYCAATRNSNEVAQLELCDKYDNMEFIWNFWGDIFKHGRSLEVLSIFKMWYFKDKNYRKFFPHIFTEVVLVRNDEEITAKTGRIYITISNAHDEEITAQLFAKRKAEILAIAQTELGEAMLNLRAEKGYPKLKAEKHEQAIEAMLWRNYFGMTSRQRILSAHRCDNPVWKSIRKGVEDCLKITKCKKKAEDLTQEELKKVVKKFNDLRKRGEDISASLLNKEIALQDVNPF